MSRFSRRQFLERLGLSAASIPLLQLGRNASAATKFPKRLIIVVTPNGIIEPLFWPKGGENDFVLHGMLEPLQEFRSKILVLAGISLQSAAVDPNIAGGHSSFPHILCPMATPRSNIPDEGVPSGYKGAGAGGLTVDQFIADRITAAGGNLPFKSLETAVMVQWSSELQRRISWRGIVPQAPEEDPYRLFDRLFGDKATPVELARLRAQRKSVLDVVGADLKEFAARVAGEDRVKIDAHLAAIRQLEQQMDATGMDATRVCTNPMLGTRIDVQKMPNYPIVGDVQMELITRSLACDLTRVVTLQWSNGAGDNVVFSWLGSEFEPMDGSDCLGDCNSHHTLSHHAGRSTDMTNPYVKRKTAAERWYASQFASLLRKLDSVREGDGTLLDNCAVLWMNNMNNGGSHCFAPVPCILAGSCGGYFRTGRFLKYGTAYRDPQNAGEMCGGGEDVTAFVPNNNLMVSLCHAMGYPEVSTFGDPKWGSGPLDNLT